MSRLLIGVAALAILAAAGAWALSAPRPLPGDALAGMTGDGEAGRIAFLSAGCASCHVEPGTATDGPPILAGGQRFATAFGTFVAPNISSGPQGVGGWSDLDLVNAMARGVSPEGAHYYPAFPYTSYARAAPADLLDIATYLRTLPPSDVASLPHEVPFPYSIRRTLGLWKQLNLRDDWVTAADAPPVVARGRYLVESLGHCGECHTPRGPLGGLDTGRWLGGAANPSGEGRIPAIHPGALDWSEADIVAYLTTGLTPEYDSAGGHMAVVVDKLAQIPRADVEAIAAYLKAIPALPATDPA